MKLHDLHPAAGSRTRRTRVGRGIAAGRGKTAGRGTKGQKARAGGSIPPWFEGGQTPLHMRIPKLRGFRNPFKIEYEVVNLGRIAALVELGALGAVEPGAPTKPKAGKATSSAAPITVNQEILRAVGLVRTLDKPLKVLGQGEIDRALFVVADAFSKSAVAKIEAAGGSVQVLQIPTAPMAALGVEPAEGPADTRVAGTGLAEDTAPAERARPSAESVAGAEPEESAHAEPAQSAQAEKPAQSAQAEKPAKQVQAEKPARPARSAKPAATAEAASPARPAKPAGAAKPDRKSAGRQAPTVTDAGPKSAPAEDEASPEAPAGADA
jgi:large subunit ribosomal protein L15